MPKYKIMFAKTGMSRFISHLDLSRLFERAFRRAGLPMAFSKGFNPHPKMSIAAPLAVGIAGERELLEIELTEEINSGEIARRLNEKLPEGVKVLAVQRAGEQKKSLMALVERAAYRIECTAAESVDQQEIDQVIGSLLNCSSIIVQRKVKNKIKETDIRPGIWALEGRVDNGNIIIEAELSTGNKGTVRPEELIKELEKAGLPINCACCRIYRTGLYGDGGEGIKELWQA
ncbi:radical SAM-linked protein [Desulfohalotomaculum tongense]|uniref:TIGR03936 family radical SAM-associated protein n=1 Tax=Desulforadius tongensis TaxID=1216062 RepID=UPI00195EE7AF|nr:TIGR03936 family radical SAM-associated protein [Desulforadius tongensis]MBM7854519.1 radical SAM-linked protein [Desulforadius tongensis]